MRIAVPIELSADETATLERWSRGRSTPSRLVLRAKIVLAAAAGQPRSFVWTATIEDILAKVGRARAVMNNGASG